MRPRSFYFSPHTHRYKRKHLNPGLRSGGSLALLKIDDSSFKTAHQLELHLSQFTIAVGFGPVELRAELRLGNAILSHNSVFVDFGSLSDLHAAQHWSAGEQHWLIDHVKRSIKQSEAGVSSLSSLDLKMYGMVGTFTRHLLRNLLSNFTAAAASAATEGATRPHRNFVSYLEVGLHTGSSFCAAVGGDGGSDIIATGIDKWGAFHQFRNRREVFDENLARCAPSMSSQSRSIRVLSGDCYDFAKALSFSGSDGAEREGSGPGKADLDPRALPVDIYFFDGPHRLMDHYRAIVDFDLLLSDVAVILVDDWQLKDVSHGLLPLFFIAIPRAMHSCVCVQHP